MDAIKGLITNIPDWVKRLDELSGQIDQRQLDLARIVESSSPTSDSSLSRTKSIRNKGSTESLRPHDETGVAHEHEEQLTPKDDAPVAAQSEAQPAVAAAQPANQDTEMTDAAEVERQINQHKQIVHAKARATLRKRVKKRSDSMVSAEGANTKQKYRTRSMIIVYYDKYVEEFFEDLVKFVSASRNMMRKAKMAAKVAQIKRMAELEMSGMEDEDDSKDSPKPATDGPILAAEPARSPGDGKIEASDAPYTPGELPKLNFVSTRNMRSPGMLAGGRAVYSRANGRASYLANRARGGGDQPQDVYDELDKGLEYVQSMCEHAAHQFLRDGDCNEEIENMKRRLAETKDVADREMERVKKEDPEALKTADEPPKTRSFRPQSMRKDTSSSSSKEAKETKEAKEAKETKEANDGKEAKEASEPRETKAILDPSLPLEVDEGIDDMDVEPPKLVFKSTRRMR